jgi:D-glycero-D-manno-heptose 1,7-bisphosphate phosphatase
MTLLRSILEEKLLYREQDRLSRAVFLDRDGTLNIDRGYIVEPSEIELYPNAGAVLQMLNSKGYLVIIISNQSAIGRGLMTEKQFEKVNQAIWDLLRQSNAYYDALYYCPHIPNDKCECRKPKPGLIFQAALDFNSDLSASYVIGDKLSDIEAGQCAGCKTILIRTGFGKESEKAMGLVNPDCIQDNLTDALAWISKHEKAG